MKRNPLKTQRNKADKLFQQVCLLLNPYSMVSGKPAQVTHHFIPKSLSNALRYDIENGITLTNGEHLQHHSQGDPEIYEKMTANKSPEWFAHIRTKRREIIKPTLTWYKSKIDELNENLSKL